MYLAGEDLIENSFFKNSVRGKATAMFLHMAI